MTTPGESKKRLMRSSLQRLFGAVHQPSPEELDAEASDKAIADVQSLLLQVSFAIMMIFMIAYFMFRNKSEQEAQEQIVELQRQKLLAAVEQVTYDSEARYGLNILTVLGEDGQIDYQPEACIENGELTKVPQLRNAFCVGASNAYRDFADTISLRRSWNASVLEKAAVSSGAVLPENIAWLNELIDSQVEKLRLRVKNVQLLSASRLQDFWVENPDKIRDPEVARLLEEFQKADETQRLLLAADVATAIRAHCLNYLADEAKTPMLP